MPFFGIPIRNGLPIGLGSVAGFGIAPFSPASLFENGEQGVWYDPSDVNLNWRRNLLTYTEEFDNAAWTKTGVTVTADTREAPDGTVTADLMTGGGNWFAGAASAGSGAANQTVTASIYIYPPAGVTSLTIRIDRSGIAQGNQTVKTVTPEVWQRVIHTATLDANTAVPVLRIDLTGGVALTVWGAQLEVGSTATAYQQIVTPEITYLQTIQAQPVLFQDSAGTTPVTAVEQAVGLMLDKSKGLVLGPELVTNGGPNITSLTSWQFQANATGSLSSGEIAVTLASSTSRAIYQDITTIIGKWYKVTITARTANGSLTVGAYDSYFAPITTNTQVATGVNQTLSVYFVAAATTTRVVVFQSASGSTTAYNVVSASLRELPGNHAYQSTSASRPILKARYNLLTYTEDFSNAVWQALSGAIKTANYAANPLGTANNAARIQIGTGVATRLESGPITVSSGVLYRQTLYVRSNTGSNQIIGFREGTSLAVSLTTVTNDWVQIPLTFTAGANAYFQIVGSNLAPGASASIDILIWGADLRPADQATGLIGPTYQRVAAATDYDTSGFLPYLSFDGTDDSMLTNSIDFSATNKMTVWAGVRKMSDAASANIAELSASASSNSGSFRFAAPNNTGASGNYGWYSRGSAIPASGASSSTILAPTTNVLSAIGDISNDVMILRLNGIQAASQTLDQGSGNYGNYPLYIGARAGASLWFNGWLTSLIVRGAQSTDAQIEATENWVNGKTGAY